MEQTAVIEPKRSLFEKLKETFPSEIVEPYGEVLIVSNRSFKPQWKEELEREGIKSYISNYGNQAVFFLRKVEKRENQDSSSVSSSETQKPEAVRQNLKTETDSKPVKYEKKLWSIEERIMLRDLYVQGASVEEISKRLNRSVFSIGAAIRHLPELKRRDARKPKEKADPETKSHREDSDIISEYLVSAILLYPKYRRACSLVLAEAIKELKRS